MAKKLTSKKFYLFLLISLILLQGNFPQGVSLAQNPYSECPPNSNSIWVFLDIHGDGTYTWVNIPFDSGYDNTDVDGPGPDAATGYINYLAGVLIAEAGTTNHPEEGQVTIFDNEFLKAQAVAVRSVAYKNCGSVDVNGHPGVDDNTKQHYNPIKAAGYSDRNRYIDAVAVTDGIYLTYSGSVFDIQYRDISKNPTNGSVSPHLSVYDPAGDYHTSSQSKTGLPKINANHWATGENHGESLPKWNYLQILTHYYTGVHLQDGNGTIITPEYRWNLLDLSWAEAGCPAIIPQNSVCTGTFLIQNTGVTAWNTSRIYLDHYTLAEQANRSTNALINPTDINITAQPGDVVTVTTSISPPPGAIAGSRHTIRFDMAYDEDIDLTYFSARETGRPWYTYDVGSCVGYCATYIPLVTKD
jgi:hypothetical protein